MREASLRSRSAVITANEIYPFYISSLFIYTVTDVMYNLLALSDFILINCECDHITSVKILFFLSFLFDESLCAHVS